MTMLNEDIVKEISKYDKMFDGFSYNDIVPEAGEHDKDDVDRGQDVLAFSAPEDELTVITKPADLKENNVPDVGHTGEADSSSDTDKDEEKVKKALLLDSATEKLPETHLISTDKPPEMPELDSTT